jgi:Lon protease-like protein
MATTIAAFPLGIVSFPGEIQNLHIFEPRYRDLISDCLEENISFAIVPFLNNKAFHLGTEMKLMKVDKKYPDGKYDVSLKSVRLIKIHKLSKKYPGKEYPVVKMTPLSWDETTDYDLSVKITQLIVRLYKALSINDRIPAPEEFLTYKIVHKIGLSVEQELSLLAIAEEKNRQNYILNHLTDFVPTVEKSQQLRLKAVLNGHFKNINPANF